MEQKNHKKPEPLSLVSISDSGISEDSLSGIHVSLALPDTAHAQEIPPGSEIDHKALEQEYLNGKEHLTDGLYNDTIIELMQSYLLNTTDRLHSEYCNLH